MADRNLPPTPDVVSVTIPAEYVADFRAAVVHEIRWEAECILGVKGGEVFNPDVAFADIRSDADLMMHDADLYANSKPPRNSSPGSWA